MQNLADSDDLLKLTVTLNLSPLLNLKKGELLSPLYQPVANKEGKVTVYADVALQFSAVTQMVDHLLKGQRFDISEGFIALHVIISAVTITGTSGGGLLIRADFTGSFRGTVYLTGTPVFNENSRSVVLLNLRQELKTKNFLLKGAQLLFAARIEKELKKAASFSLNQYIERAELAINDYLNREWQEGVTSSGSVSKVQLTEIRVLPQHLLLRVGCEASLQVTLSELLVKLQR